MTTNLLFVNQNPNGTGTTSVEARRAIGALLAVQNGKPRVGRFFSGPDKTPLFLPSSDLAVTMDPAEFAARRSDVDGTHIATFERTKITLSAAPAQGSRIDLIYLSLSESNGSTGTSIAQIKSKEGVASNNPSRPATPSDAHLVLGTVRVRQNATSTQAADITTLVQNTGDYGWKEELAPTVNSKYWKTAGGFVRQENSDGTAEISLGCYIQWTDSDVSEYSTTDSKSDYAYRRNGWMLMRGADFTPTGYKPRIPVYGKSPVIRQDTGWEAPYNWDWALDTNGRFWLRVENKSTWRANKLCGPYITANYTARKP